MKWKSIQQKREYYKKWRDENREKHRGYNKKYRLNPEYRKRERIWNKKSKEKWRRKNLDKCYEYNRKWITKNQDKMWEWRREYQKKWRKTEKGRKSFNNWQAKQFKENPKYRLDKNMTRSIYDALKGKKGGRKWEILVGYRVEDLIKHLEKQFDDKMNWENYGSYWWIDHIKPKSLFKYINPEEEKFKECWALKNLRPLEKMANIKKNNHF